jgi:hypothetical protein
MVHGSRKCEDLCLKGGQLVNEKELLDEIFELALQNDMTYLG